MRRLGSVIALAAVALGLTVARPAQAATPSAPAPAGFVAPYDAFTFNHVINSQLLAANSDSYDDSNATFGYGLAPANGVNLFIDPNGTGTDWEVYIVALSGQSLSTGTFPVTSTPGGDDAQFSLSYQEALPCAYTGTMTISDLSQDPTSHQVTALALGYDVTCTDGSTLSGDLRYKDDVAFTAASLSPTSGDDGSQYVGSSLPHTITFTDTGTTSITLNATNLTTPDPSAYAISSDGCSGATLDAGGSCQVVVDVHVTGLTTLTASLTLDDSPSLTPITLPFTITGIPTATVTATPGPGSITLSWTQLAAVGDFFYYQVLRGTSPTSMTMLDTVDPNDSYTDDTPVAGVVYYYSVQEVARGGTGPATRPIAAETWPAGGAGTYVPVTPLRILDTRTTIGGHHGLLKGGSTITVTVGGIPYDPARHINAGEAAVLNLTAVGPSNATYLTVWPYGRGRPTASSLNVRAHETRANLVTVMLGSARRVDIYSRAGSVNVVADLVGYYTTANATTGGVQGGLYHPYASASRIFDTRTSRLGALPSGYEVTLSLTGFPALVEQHLTAVAVTITAFGGSAPGHLTTWDPDLSPLPRTSTLNFQNAAPVPNLAIIRTERMFTGNADDPYTPPKIAVYNGSSRPVQLAVDIEGYYDDDQLPYGARLIPTSPTRIIDSRYGLGLTRALHAGQTAAFNPSWHADYWTTALDLNVTAVAPTTSAYQTLWAAGVPGVSRPGTSNLNEAAGQTVADHVLAPVGANNLIDIFNDAGITNIVADLGGRFDVYPFITAGSSPGAQPADRSAQVGASPAAPPVAGLPATAQLGRPAR